jgi:hypothetical protein
MRKITQGELVYYQFETLAQVQRIDHGVFTRLGGSSEGDFKTLNIGLTVGDKPESVYANRRRMAAALNVRDEDVRTSWQVHGDRVLECRPDDPLYDFDSIPRADSLITNQPGMPLGMRYADCVPLMFYDPVQHALGVAHAGWRGTVAGVGVKTVQAMQEEYGSHPQDVIAGIGPSIGPCCYEVGQDVLEQVESAFGKRAQELISPRENGQASHLDLWAANAIALEDAGVRSIEQSMICTSCNKHEFFSHRAESGKTGRFGALIVLA